MKFFKKNAFILLGLGIITLFLFTRLYNILGLPIFTDEAIYVRWAQIAANDAAWRFISLTDGKQPMYVWIAMILMKLINDPLLAGRVVSVLAGFSSMVGLFFLTNEMFKNKKIALLVSFIYVLYPFSLVYDRMALYDSLVAMFIIWSLYFEILLVRFIRLDLAMILGMIIGFGMLTKTNANFALVLMPFLLLLFDFKAKDWKKRLGKLTLFALVAVVIANVMYSILRLSPFFHIIADKNFVFAFTPQELLQAPFAHLFDNLRPLTDWMVYYMTLPFMVLVASAFLVGKKYLKEKLLLLIWFAAPFFAAAIIGRLLYPRFILFMTMPLLVLGGYTLYYAFQFAKKVWLQILILIVFLAMFAINDYFIITDFAKASVPKSDKGQFIASWPSGVGVKETVAFLKEKAKTEKVFVATEGTFGLMPYSLEMYFYNNSNVTVKAFWPVTDLPPDYLIAASKKMSTYVVFYQPCIQCEHSGIAPVRWNLNPVMQFSKLEDKTFYTLYQLKSQ
ncbi:glycosyltransferase family 39 protein [Candidatus Roizmanbacteria bacterium]|nr:glycosyltransferase family 39 protein [Candidatus Roizmanbacteria bacterium]